VLAALAAPASQPKRFVSVKGGHENAYHVDTTVYYGAIAQLLNEAAPGR
jgi:hypothetical protein